MRFLRLLLVILPFVGPLAASGSADEPPPVEPPTPAPVEPPKPGEPPAPADPAEPPAPEDPAAPPEEVPAPPPPPPLDEEEQALRDAEEQKRREEERKRAEQDDGVERPPLPEPPRPGPGGTRYVPGAEAAIGTGNEELGKLLGERSADVRKQFDYERPLHAHAVPAFWIDATEVTNGQYAKFLDDQRTAYVCDGKLATLPDVVASSHFLNLSRKEQEGDDVAWRQLALTNKDALVAAMPDVPFPAGFKAAVLPRRDLTLVFTKRRPPDDWPAMWPDPERLAHPVRYVSCLDALAFCEWAGKHLQSEFEYEYAARGPEAWQFPWGTKWKSDLSRCNWGAKNVNPKTHEADTWPVGSCPAGRSQFDVHDLLGNVAEWTDSWFLPYPGGNQNHDFMRAVKIIRGGTAVDQELIVLRPAYRNFIGEGYKLPPYPENRFRWVGFRCAWWPQPGANQAPAILGRIYRGGRLKVAREENADLGASARPDQLDDTRRAGAVAENFIPTDIEAENGVGVLGRCRAVVAIPRSYVLDTEDKSTEALSVTRAKSKSGLLGESETENPVVMLGAFHTDARLPKVWVRAVLPPPANEEERKAREKEKEKKRGKSEAPPVVEGICLPGSYLLGLWHKRLCLLDESREFRCFLTAPDKTPNLDVRKLKDDEAPPPCKVEVDADLGTISATFTMPLLIGKGADATPWLITSFSVEADAKDLESANGWR